MTRRKSTQTTLDQHEVAAMGKRGLEACEAAWKVLQPKIAAGEQYRRALQRFPFLLRRRLAEPNVRDVHRMLASCIADNSNYVQRLVELEEQARADALGQPWKADADREARAQVRARAGEAAAPYSNTGGAEARTAKTVQLVLSDGTLKEVMVRTPGAGQCAILDWVNFTVGAETCWQLGARTPAPRDMVIALSGKLEAIFGFPVTRQCEKGRNFYKYSFQLGEGYGFVCIGGQRNTVLVMISGTGLTAAKDGWEKRLYDFLKIEAVTPKLTRIDCAHDDFEGAYYTVDQAKTDHAAGGYTCHVMEPDCEERGNWKRPNGKGRSFYVGHRANGKFARIYEKGMELGQKGHPWVRVEVEFKAVDRVIPFEVLLNPGEYLAAAYPALSFLQEKQTRIETYQREAEASYSTLTDWLKRQCGPALNFMLQVEGSAQAVLDKVMREATPGRMAKYVLHDEHDPIDTTTPTASTLEQLAELAFPITSHAVFPAPAAMA